MRSTVAFGILALAAVVAVGTANAQSGQVETILRGATGVGNGVSSPLGGGLGSALTPRSAQSNGLFDNVFGCAASGSTQIIGAVGGGVVGGFVGGKVKKTVGTIAGGALGAAAGSYLGCRLQRSSQARAERAAQEAAATGQGQQWSDPATGASGRSDVVAGAGQSLAGMRLAKGVTPIVDYEMVGGVSSVNKTANVRGTPSASGVLLGKLQPGQTVTVSARTPAADWSLISQDGVGIGYVSSALLAPTRPMASSGCRTIRQTIRSGGQSDSQLLNACPDRNGGWAFTKAG